MAGVPVKVSNELAEAAREMAELANRSMTKQIEHWAELGRAVEHLAPMSDQVTFKASCTSPHDAVKTAAARAALERLVSTLAANNDRAAALKLIRDTGKPVYEAVTGREASVQQVWPDGRRVVGRIVDREFVADEPTCGLPT